MQGEREQHLQHRRKHSPQGFLSYVDRLVAALSPLSGPLLLNWLLESAWVAYKREVLNGRALNKMVASKKAEAYLSPTEKARS